MKSNQEIERIVANRGAWTAGYQAAHIGQPNCPYNDPAQAREWRKGCKQCRFDQATEHPVECGCDLCKAWHAAMGKEL